MPESRRLAGNEPLPLAPQGACWRVEAGCLALFSVAQRDGHPWGARSYLFTVEAGAAVFGLPSDVDDAERSVLAVPLEAAEVVETTLLDLPREEGRALFEAWARRWATCLDVAPPVAASGRGWLSATPAFHRWVLAALERRAEREHAAEVRQVTTRSRRTTESARIAVAALSAVLQRSGAGAPAVGDALYRAAFAVSAHLGTELRPLPQSVDPARIRDPLESLARASRLRVRRVLLREAWWRRDCGPLLAYRGPDELPVALLPRPGGGYELFDPTAEERRPLDEELAVELDPVARSFYRPFPEGPLGARDVLRFALSGRARDIAGLLASALAVTLLAMTLPIATGVVIDVAIPTADRALLAQVLGGLLAAALGAGMFRLSSGLLLARAEARADADTQAAVWDRLLRLRPDFFRGFTVGDLQARLGAIGQIRSLLSGTTLRTALASALASLNLVLLVAISPPLALIAVAAALVSGAATALACVALVRAERRAQRLQGELFGAVVQIVQGITKLRVRAAEERAFLFWAKRYSEQQELVLETQRLRDALAVLNTALWAASLMVLFAAATELLERPGGGLSTGEFLAFSAAYGAFLGGVTHLAGVLPDLAVVPVLEERARPILTAEPEVSLLKADPGRLRGRLELQRVVFRYRHDGPLVLHDVSLAVEPGEMVALVGPSGSGKSTLLRLLLGFELPESGAVLVDGQDLRGLDMQAVRQQLGVVLQAGRIGAGSIFETVAGGARVTLSEVEEALRMAGLAEDVRRMPMGVHTVISEGGMNLSGGQRQRLLIARALVRRPAVLLFDEATSALDNRTQAIVTESLERLAVTRVVIAHRLSTIRSADRVVVIDQGRVVEEGEFDALMARGGLFARLMRRQMA